MKEEKLNIHYDKETDILEIEIGEQTEMYFDEIDDDIFEGHDENTEELKGYKILNFTKRGGIKDINIPLPAGIEIKNMH
jgi:uncharacterized protein YuzE